MMICNKDRKISFIIAVFTFLTLIFCCSHICEAAGTKLVWDESPESNVEGYYLYYGTESKNYTDFVQVIGKTTTSYLIADFNFTPNQTNYIVITAYTDTGEKSEYSNEIVYEEIEPETVTGLQSPTHSIGECSSNPEIAVQWTAAVDARGSGLDGYSIIWNTESDTLPDTTKDIEDVTTVTSPSLSDGSYYFHIRSVDNAFNWGDAAEHLGPFCIDTTVPSAPTVLGATPGDGQVALSWTNPTDVDFIGTMIRYRTDGTYPANHTDGTAVENGNDGKFVNSPGSNDGFDHTGLQNGTTYYYSAFTYDEVPNYSEAVHASATPTASSPPPDTIDPTVTIAQPTSTNTYITDQKTITLCGTASDNIGVTSVTWTNSRGGEGSASGTDTWTISNISLHEGDNLITVTAHDDALNTGTDTLTVTCTYTPPAGTYTEEFGSATGTDYPGTLEDTYININEIEYSTHERLCMYTFPEDKVANAIILKWDLSAIPSSATIQDATLHLNMETAGGDDLYDLTVHKIVNHNPVISACTGYTYDGTNLWTPNTQCSDNIPLAQADIALAEDTKSTDTTYGYKSWSVTNMVQDWISNSASNYGMLVNSDPVASSNSKRYFSSTESSNPDQRPKLVVTYSVGEDVTPPADVSDFAADPGDGQVALSWTNPTDDDFVGTMIRYRTDSTHPTDHSDGTLVCNRTGAPGSEDSFTHTQDVQNGTTYYYSAFTYDEVSNYSEAAHVSTTPTAAPPNVAPTASFNANPTSGDAPLSVQFTDTSIDPDGTVASWNWDFGDGGTSTAQNPGHTYKSAGTYTVILTVTDDDDATDNASTTIFVSSRETVSIYIEAESGTLDSPMKIGDNPNPKASGGEYVYAPAGSGNTTNPTAEAVYNIDIPYAGDYYLWLRMYGPTGDNDAMYIGFNGNFDMVYPARWEKYEWVRVETTHGSENFAHLLSAGTNQINIGHGEELARVDIIFVTNDPDRIPYALIIN